MLFKWFEIVDVFPLPEVGGARSGKMPDDWRSLAIQYISSVRIDIGKEYLVRVDAIPLLYELIIAVSAATLDDMDIEIGEGWWLKGRAVSNRRRMLRVEFGVGNDLERVGEQEVSVDDLIVFLSTRISLMVDRLEENGVHVLELLNRFPTALKGR